MTENECIETQSFYEYNWVTEITYESHFSFKSWSFWNFVQV